MTEYPKALTTKAYRVEAARLLPHLQLIRYVRDGKIHVVRVLGRPDIEMIGSRSHVPTDGGVIVFEAGEVVGQLETDEGIETPFSTDIPRNPQ